MQVAREKHLIKGNHDKDWMKKTDLEKHFYSVSNMLEFGDGSHKIILCHYPLMTWNGIAKGSFHIHGHILQKLLKRTEGTFNIITACSESPAVDK